MRIEINDKSITRIATNIGVNITPVQPDLSNVVYSLNDENGDSIQSGFAQFDSGDTTEILQALFQKLNITEKNATVNTTTGTPES